MRSDTERLQFFLKFLNDTGGAGYSVETIDAAMDAAEAGELEEAWKTFRGKAEAGEWDLIYFADRKMWRVGIATAVHDPISCGPTADAAVLAAHRASKGGEE